MVNHQLLVESKTNDRRSGPLASQSVGIAAKTCSSTKARPSLSWIEVKDAPPQRSASFFKSLLLLPALHQDTRGAGLPSSGRLELPASPRPCEELPRGERWGSDPMGPPSRVRAARLRLPPIPSPTVTAGTGLHPFKHIICARMAVKALRHHRTARLRRTHTGLQSIVCDCALLSSDMKGNKRTLQCFLFLDL